MSEESLNSKKSIKKIRRGLSIYKTGRSPYWYARIYDLVKRKYVVHSTKQTNRLKAVEVAEEIQETYKSNQNAFHAIRKDRSFEHYAYLLFAMTEQKARSSRSKYAGRDLRKLLYRENVGLVSYFGKYDVGKITSGMVRDYLLLLDQRRDEPLAMSTKLKQCGVIRQVPIIALEDGLIDIIPQLPKHRTVDKPQVSFQGIAKLSNRNHYDFGEEEVQKIFTVLRKELGETQSIYAASLSKSSNNFNLDS